MRQEHRNQKSNLRQTAFLVVLCLSLQASRPAIAEDNAWKKTWNLIQAYWNDPNPTTGLAAGLTGFALAAGLFAGFYASQSNDRQNIIQQELNSENREALNRIEIEAGRPPKYEDCDSRVGALGRLKYRVKQVVAATAGTAALGFGALGAHSAYTLLKNGQNPLEVARKAEEETENKRGRELVEKVLREREKEKKVAPANENKIAVNHDPKPVAIPPNGEVREAAPKITATKNSNSRVVTEAITPPSGPNLATTGDAGKPSSQSRVEGFHVSLIESIKSKTFRGLVISDLKSVYVEQFSEKRREQQAELINAVDRALTEENMKRASLRTFQEFRLRSADAQAEWLENEENRQKFYRSLLKNMFPNHTRVAFETNIFTQMEKEISSRWSNGTK